MHLIGVLLAAGRSTRMGRLKQLLAWPLQGSVPISGSEEMGTDPFAVPSKPLVAAAYDSIAPACCAMVVVVGHEAEAVAAALGGRRFERVPVDPTAEMLASVKAGLAAARELHPTADVLLHPADHPQVRRETLDVLVATAAGAPGRAVMPEFDGQGGHPVLIPAALVREIISYDGTGGLRQFWLDHSQRCVRLPVDDQGVVIDIDLPSDYSLGVQ